MKGEKMHRPCVRAAHRSGQNSSCVRAAHRSGQNSSSAPAIAAIGTCTQGPIMCFCEKPHLPVPPAAAKAPTIGVVHSPQANTSMCHQGSQKQSPWASQARNMLLGPQQQICRLAAQTPTSATTPLVCHTHSRLPEEWQQNLQPLTPIPPLSSHPDLPRVWQPNSFAYEYYHVPVPGTR